MPTLVPESLVPEFRDRVEMFEGTTSDCTIEALVPTLVPEVLGPVPEFRDRAEMLEGSTSDCTIEAPVPTLVPENSVPEFPGTFPGNSGT